jgi:hypothetical protein
MPGPDAGDRDVAQQRELQTDPADAGHQLQRTDPARAETHDVGRVQRAAITQNSRPKTAFGPVVSICAEELR